MPNRPHNEGFDPTKPHGARVWNFWLGGNDNFKADQEAGRAYASLFPGIYDFARASRAFLERSAAFMARQGLYQFLDVASGLPAPLPTAPPTHKVVQEINPAARIAYTDLDPLVNLHNHVALTSTAEGHTGYFQSNMTDTDEVLEGARATLDLAQPVGLIFSDCLGHIEDYDEALGAVRRLTAELAPGSLLMISHAVDTDPVQVAAQEQYNAAADMKYILRTPAQIAAFVDGLQSCPPGAVPWADWNPDANTLPVRSGYGVVARIP